MKKSFFARVWSADLCSSHKNVWIESVTFEARNEVMIESFVEKDSIFPPKYE